MFHSAFHSARLKLTVWYLIIIMVVSLLFSVSIFQLVSRQLERGFRAAQLRAYAQGSGIPVPPKINQNIEQMHPEFKDVKFEEVKDVYLESRENLLRILVAVNGLIFVVSAMGGYVLSGVTLKPIKDAMDEQQQFVSDASHELRTPLTAIRTSLEVNLEDKKLSKKSKEILQENLKQILSLERLAGRLLQLIKGSQKLTQHFAKVDMHQVVTDAVEVFRASAQRKKVKLQFEASKEHFWIKGDKQSLEELVGIFLDNAIKYTPEGGVISVGLGLEKNKVVLRIKDTGIGIAEKDVPHIFDRFYQADAARTKVKGQNGHGLGLALARRLAEQHKAKITVTSMVDVGSEFVISFPVLS